VAKVDQLLENYRRHVGLRWEQGIAGKQKVWFAVYDNTMERGVRLRLDDFAAATKQAGHGWIPVDLTDAFPRWMAGHDYRDAYFASPDDMDDDAKAAFDEALAVQVQTALDAADERTVVAIVGCGCLFGITRLSLLLGRVEGAIRGRLLVFFPGSYDESHGYKLLEARRDWNYLAVPITASQT
jgi:hypothetical protein